MSMKVASLDHVNSPLLRGPGADRYRPLPNKLCAWLRPDLNCSVGVTAGSDFGPAV